MTSYRMGCLPAVRPAALKDLAVYSNGPLLTPPPTVAVPAGAQYPIDGNAVYGCCTIDGVVHFREGTEAKYNLKLPPVNEAAVIAEYLKLGNGQDNGLAENDVLKVWQTDGLFGDKIFGYAPINPIDTLAIHSSVAFYDGAYLGIGCPRSAQEQFANGEPWTYKGEEPEGGHCIVALGYDEVGDLLCASWGGIVKVTESFKAHYLNEVWCILSEELVALKKDSLGIDLSSLVADLAHV